MKPFRFFRDFGIELLAAHLIFLLIFSGCVSLQQQEQTVGIHYTETVNTETVFDSASRMQVDRIFPIPLEIYDEGILPNNYISFVAYKEQAKLYFLAKNLRSFDLYLNNVKLSAQQLCTGTPVCFDASRYVQNGVNVLYIAGLTPKESAEEPAENSKPFLQIKIPYPVVLPTQIGGTEADYSIEALNLVDQLLTAETAHGFPGAQLVVVKNGRMIKNAAYGTINSVDGSGHSLEKPLPVTTHTLFDIASNTKIYAATFAVQKLISEEKIFLTDTVHQFFPDFVDGKKDSIKGKELITVFDLLTHRSGFPAGGNYAKKIEKLKVSVRKQKTDRQHTFDFIMKTPLAYAPRSKFIYSDINFMLLTYIIEKITGMPLDAYVQESFYAPLKLDRICFKPLEKGFQMDEIAATEIAAKPRGKTANRGIKTQPVHGVVHDYDAYVAMEQVSGHAGLFTNAETLAVLAQIMLNNGGYGSQRFFAPSVTGFFTAQHTLVSSMGLGWRRQGKKAYTWAFSPFASENTFGHTGWTGTLTLIDPEEHLIIILLTNAKNTLPPSSSRRGRLEGDYYLAKRYGPIATLIYEAFHNPPPSKLDGMLMELAEQKYKMLVEIEAFQNKGYIGDLTAIMETIKKRSAHSELLQTFLKSDTAQRIEAAVSM